MADNKFKNGPGGRLVQAQADNTRVDFDPRPKGPQIVEYDEINYANPFDWKLGLVKGLKKANTLLGGNIEQGGYNRESYGDLIDRLKRTPGTIQNTINNNPALKSTGINEAAAYAGETVLDPVNKIPVGKLSRLGIMIAATRKKVPEKSAWVLRQMAGAGPYIIKGNEVYQSAQNIMNPKEREDVMTPQQKEFVKKLSGYNFGNVK